MTVNPRKREYTKIVTIDTANGALWETKSICSQQKLGEAREIALGL